MNAPALDLIYRFRIDRFIGAVHTNDERLLGILRQVFFCEDETGEAPHAVYRAFVHRRMSGTRRHEITRDGRTLLVSPFFPSLMPAIEHDVVHSLGGVLTDHCVLGAGALLHEGEAFLVAGGTDIGLKNKLIRDLCAHGCVYYGDDVTLLQRSSGQLTPLAKSISHARPRHNLLSRKQRGAAFRSSERLAYSYDGPPPHRPALGEPGPIVRHVIFLGPADPERIGSQRLSMAGGCARLFERLHASEGGEQGAFELLSRIAEGCRFHEVTPGRLKASRELILSLLHSNGQNPPAADGGDPS